MRVLSVLPFILLAQQCENPFAPDEWWGVLYPDRNNLLSFEDLGTFETLENCRIAILDHAAFLDLNDTQFDYECGLNCRPFRGDTELRVCDETQR